MHLFQHLNLQLTSFVASVNLFRHTTRNFNLTSFLTEQLGGDMTLYDVLTFG